MWPGLSAVVRGWGFDHPPAILIWVRVGFPVEPAADDRARVIIRKLKRALEQTSIAAALGHWERTYRASISVLDWPIATQPLS